MNYILSIIIPIYGVENFIQACLDSIIPQIINRNDVELVLVNDGTKDHSAEMADVAIRGVQSAKLISQKNQGLSMARNNGLEIATGEYVWFIDSDDSISEGCISEIIKKLSERPDMLQLNYQNTFEDGRPSVPVIFNGDYASSRAGKYVMARGGLPAPAPFTIYRRSFLIENKLFFTPAIYHEDSEFKPRATYLAQSITCHKPVVYNYLHRNGGSITSSFRLKNGIDIIYVNDSLHSFYERHVTEKECIREFCRCIGLNMNTLLAGLGSLQEKERKRLINLMVDKKYLFKDMLRSGNSKYKLEGLLFLLNANIALKLHGFLRKADI